MFDELCGHFYITFINLALPDRFDVRRIKRQIVEVLQSGRATEFPDLKDVITLFEIDDVLESVDVVIRRNAQPHDGESRHLSGFQRWRKLHHNLTSLQICELQRRETKLPP